jgi:hypothetical protein
MFGFVPADRGGALARADVAAKHRMTKVLKIAFMGHVLSGYQVHKVANLGFARASLEDERWNFLRLVHRKRGRAANVAPN